MNKRELEKFIGKIVAEQTKPKSRDPNTMSDKELENLIYLYTKKLERIYNGAGIDYEESERAVGSIISYFQTKVAELQKILQARSLNEQAFIKPDPNNMSKKELQKQIDRYMEMVEKVYDEVGDDDFTEREMNYIDFYARKAAELEKVLKSKLNEQQTKDPNKDDWDLFEEVEDIFSRHLGGIEKELDDLADRFIELGFPEVADEIWSILMPKVEKRMYDIVKSWREGYTYQDPFDDLR